MSLQGTLDTFSLAEILGLLEKARKTGALEVRDPQSRGVLYLAGGRFSGAEAGDLAGPVETAEELDARLVDVCFALFRLESGAYEFEGDRFPPWPVRGGSEIGPIIEQVQQIRRDWLAIEAVIPSLDAAPRLVGDLGGDRLILDRTGFRVLRVVDGVRSVRSIARELGRSVLEVCRVLKDLVDAGAVEVALDPEPTMVDELVLPEPTPPPEPAPAADVPDRDAADLSLVLDDAAIAADFAPAPPHPPTPITESLRRPADVPPLVPEEPAPVPPDRTTPPAPVPARPGTGDARAADADGAAEPSGADPDPDDPGSPDPAPDRGALLRMFSALRDN